MAALEKPVRSKSADCCIVSFLCSSRVGVCPKLQESQGSEGGHKGLHLKGVLYTSVPYTMYDGIIY